jgi:hypothetical protein
METFALKPAPEFLDNLLDSDAVLATASDSHSHPIESSLYQDDHTATTKFTQLVAGLYASVQTDSIQAHLPHHNLLSFGTFQREPNTGTSTKDDPVRVSKISNMPDGAFKVSKNLEPKEVAAHQPPYGWLTILLTYHHNGSGLPFPFHTCTQCCCYSSILATFFDISLPRGASFR